VGGGWEKTDNEDGKESGFRPGDENKKWGRGGQRGLVDGVVGK